MSRTHRFRCAALAAAEAGSTVRLSPEEVRHLRVLRLRPGAGLELFDGAGTSAHAVLLELDGSGASARVAELERPRSLGGGLVLAVAWPKGKRAAVLVEKCAELGVDRILPVRYVRSVVQKDGESEGLQRLKRIAGEAAKQSGRSTEPLILDEAGFEAALQLEPGALKLLLDPRAERSLPERLAERAGRSVMLFIGPEGGIAPGELRAAEQAGVKSARLAEHILRIETAALAACAVAGACALAQHGSAVPPPAASN
jgi:16S rRNA (uracil1498-N3)-methyltransferase